MNPEATAAADPAAALGAEPAPAAADPGAASQPLGLAELAHTLWDDLRGALTERLKLAGMELRLAGLTLVQVMVYAVIVAVLVVTAWLGLVAGVVAGFVGAGLHWAIALAIGIVINLAVAAWLVRSMMRMVERVGLPASLRGFHQRARTPDTDHAA